MSPLAAHEREPQHDEIDDSEAGTEDEIPAHFHVHATRNADTGNEEPRHQDGHVDDPGCADLIHEVQLAARPEPELAGEHRHAELLLDALQTSPEHRAVLDPTQLVHEETKGDGSAEYADRNKEPAACGALHPQAKKKGA